MSLLNLFSGLMGNQQNNFNCGNGENNNQVCNCAKCKQAYFAPPNQTNYPETFFTYGHNTQPTSHVAQTNQNFNSQTSSNFGLGNLLNSDAIKNLLPLLIGKGGSNGALNAMSGENFNLSQVLSLFSKNNKKSEKNAQKDEKTDKKDEKTNKKDENVIDLSKFNEIE